VYPAADLVEALHPQRGDMKRVEYVGRIGQVGA
jgi:hypothetical protein